MPYPVKGLLDVYEDMVEILLMLQVFLAEDPEIEYLSAMLLPALKPACSSAMNSSACGWSLSAVTYVVVLTISSHSYRARCRSLKPCKTIT